MPPASTAPPREESPARERSPARGDSPARDGTADPAATEAATEDLGVGNPLAQKLSLGFCFFRFSFLGFLIDFPPFFVLQTHLRLSQWRQRAPGEEGAGADVTPGEEAAGAAAEDGEGSGDRTDDPEAAGAPHAIAATGAGSSQATATAPAKRARDPTPPPRRTGGGPDFDLSALSSDEEEEE